MRTKIREGVSYWSKFFSGSTGILFIWDFTSVVATAMCTILLACPDFKALRAFTFTSIIEKL
jgi:hypothetical protein